MFELLTSPCGTPLFVPGGGLGAYVHVSGETFEGSGTETDPRRYIPTEAANHPHVYGCQSMDTEMLP